MFRSYVFFVEDPQKERGKQPGRFALAGNRKAATGAANHHPYVIGRLYGCQIN